MDFKSKYLKYKNKYLFLKNIHSIQLGGSNSIPPPPPGFVPLGTNNSLVDNTNKLNLTNGISSKSSSGGYNSVKPIEQTKEITEYINKIRLIENKEDQLKLAPRLPKKEIKTKRSIEEKLKEITELTRAHFSTTRKSLIIDNIIGNEVLRKLANIEYKDPFQLFYNNRKTNLINNYAVSVSDINQEKSFKIRPFDYKFEKEELFSTSQIPVFFRKIKEAIVYLFSDFYYDEINFNNIKLKDENMKNFNPHLFDSFYYNDYLISSTITPLFPKDLIIYGINYKTKRTYSSLDFYFDPTFLINMYKLLLFINKRIPNYILFNAIENGSLYETFHFHVIESFTPLLNILTYPDLLIFNDDNFFKKITTDDNVPYANGYLFNLSDPKFYNILFNLPALLYDLRYHAPTNMKYTSEIYLFTDFMNDEKNYMYLVFRRVPVSEIKLVDERLPKNYWNFLYGKSNENHHIRYLPIGLVNYKTENINLGEQEITEKLNDITITREMKIPYVHHPDFEVKLEKHMKTSIKNLSNSMSKEEPTMDELRAQKDMVCNLNNTFVLQYKEAELIGCDKLPIVYNFKDATILGTSNIKNGLMLIDGTYFYYIKNPNDRSKYNFTQKLLDKDDINHQEDAKDIFLTLYTILNVINEEYLLYTHVRTYFTEYIRNLEKDKLRRDSSIINSFIIMIVYKMIKLQKKGIRLTNLDINNFYLVENNIKVIDYQFNDKIIVSIAKEYTEKCNFKLFHEGFDVYFPFDFVKQNYSVDIMLRDLKNIINQLHHLCQENGINNILLNDMNTTFDRAYNLDTIIYKFSFGIDYHTCKFPNYESMELIKKYMFYGNNDNLYSNIVDKLKSSRDIDFAKYPIITLDTPDFFISGTNSDEGIDPYLANELKYRINNQPTYFYRIKNNDMDSINDQYFNYLLEVYARSNSTSRVYFYKAHKPVKIINMLLGDWNCEEYYKLSRDDTFKYFEAKANIYFEIITTIYDMTEEQTRIFKEEILDGFHIDRSAFHILQDIMNFSLRIKYPDIAGYFNNGIFHDQYIFFKKEELFCYAIAKLNRRASHILFEIFYDYNTYYESVKNIKSIEYYYNINEESYYKLCEFMILNNNNKSVKDNIDFYNLPRTDISTLFFEYNS